MSMRRDSECRSFTAVIQTVLPIVRTDRAGHCGPIALRRAVTSAHGPARRGGVVGADRAPATRTWPVTGATKGDTVPRQARGLKLEEGSTTSMRLRGTLCVWRSDGWHS